MAERTEGDLPWNRDEDEDDVLYTFEASEAREGEDDENWGDGFIYPTGKHGWGNEDFQSSRSQLEDDLFEY